MSGKVSGIPDRLEFHLKYEQHLGCIAHVNSPMVPPINSRISIRGVSYDVTHVEYAIDAADTPIIRHMVAYVWLEERGE